MFSLSIVNLFFVAASAVAVVVVVVCVVCDFDRTITLYESKDRAREMESCCIVCCESDSKIVTYQFLTCCTHVSLNHHQRTPM